MCMMEILGSCGVLWPMVRSHRDSSILGLRVSGVSKRVHSSRDAYDLCRFVSS